jgi:hypothetical protein
MKQKDFFISLIITVFSILFVILILTHRDLFDWVFERHKNLWSWYIKPIFILPFCWLAYKRNLIGLSVCILIFVSSFFWFPAPEVISESVKDIVGQEVTWLFSEWTFAKISATVSFSLSLITLALAFWKRSLWIGLAFVLVSIFTKIAWNEMVFEELGFTVLMGLLFSLSASVLTLYIFHKNLKTKSLSK